MILKSKKNTALLALAALFMMMLTSCKALVGGGEITTSYTIANIVIAIIAFAFDMILDSRIDAKYGKHKVADSKSLKSLPGYISIVLLILPFICRPFALFNILILALCVVIAVCEKIFITIPDTKKNAGKEPDKNDKE